MISRPLVKSGTVVWRIYIGEIDGKKRYKQFPTKAKAEHYIRQEKIRRKNHGQMAMKASNQEVAEYLELSKSLKEKGVSMRDAVVFYLQHLEDTQNPTQLLVAIDDYIASIKPILAPATVADYRKLLRHFAKERQHLQVDEASRDTRSYLTEYLKTRSQQTTDNSRRALSAFFSWGVDHGMLKLNPCSKIRSYLSKKKGKAVVFLPNEVRLILQKLESDFDSEVAAYVIVSFFGGVRPKEFRKKITKNGKQIPVALEWESIDRLNGEVVISEDLSKTNLYRTVQNETLKLWLQWIDQQADHELSGELFGWRFRHKWADWRKRNVPNLYFAPDIMRHTFGTYRLKALASAGAVALEMGNSEAIVKQHYLDARRPLKDAEAYWAFTPNKLFT